MAWYKTGTITVTNGSTTVTGSGTQFISNVAIGEALYAPDGRLYEITNVASDTAFTISPAYLGATAAGQNYVIVPSQSYIRDLAAQAADLVNNYSTIANFAGQGKFGDGTVTEPGIRFSDDLDTGIYRIGSNILGISAGGGERFRATATGVQYTGTLTGSTGVLNIGSGQIYKDASGNVGIGTSSLSGKLQINSNTGGWSSSNYGKDLLVYNSSANPTIGIFDFAGANPIAITNASGDFVFSAMPEITNSLAPPLFLLRITRTGNVGIGTSSPLSTFSGLDISSGGRTLVLGANNDSSTRSDATEKIVRIAGTHYNNASTPYTIINSAGTATDNTVNIGGGTGVLNSATLIRFFTGGTNTTINGSERARIDSSGNLLVGATSAVNVGSGSTDGTTVYPGNSAAGCIQASNNNNIVMYLRRRSSDGTVLQFHRDTTAVGTISVTTTSTSYNTSGTSGLTGVDANTIAFRTNNAERMRITAAGVVEINSGYVTLNGNQIGGIQVTIADDAFAEITPPRIGGGFVSVTMTGNTAFPDSSCFGFVYADWGGSPGVSYITDPNNFNASSAGPPTGTTGTDDRLTLFVGGTSGKVYLENRRGATRSCQITFT